MRHSGNVITPNVDDESLKALQEAQAEHRKNGQNFSQSVLVRRAIRHYLQHLKIDCPDYDEELK